MQDAYRVLVYGQSSGNLGDIIQTAALTRFLPKTIGIYREQIKRPFLTKYKFVLNGFLYEMPAENNCLFAGIHTYFGKKLLLRHPIKGQLARLRNSHHTIGARDPSTEKNLQSLGLDVQMIGCATLTFDRYKGPRQGIYSVDFNGPGKYISHTIAPGMSVTDQWNSAIRNLELYKAAERVYTTRLHVALPCLAFGTPVLFVPPKGVFDQSRLSLLSFLGVEFGRICTQDVSSIKKKYISFLTKQLGRHIKPAEPKMPILMNSPENTFRWSLWNIEQKVRHKFRKLLYQKDL